MYWQLCRNHELHYANSSTSFHEFMYFISRVHLLHWVDTYGWFGWMRRLYQPKETTALAEGDDWVSWRSRMRWLKESNPMTKGIECDGWRNRMRWQNETAAVAGGDGCKQQIPGLYRSIERIVYLLIPTSNHNLWACLTRSIGVVYLLIPTSNHNYSPIM